ncbi:MAG: hypothetical protein WD875_12200 [Pirellulales bacterium]
MLIVFLSLIVLGSVACLWNRGIWGAGQSLVNTVFAALLAMNLFEPLADELGSPKSNMMDFVCLWGLFAAFFAVFRLATDIVSRVKVRFPFGIDTVGAVVLAIATGWILFCFTMVSFHVSPLARSPFLGSFMETPDQKMLGVGPDRLWLAFTRQASLGVFSAGGDGFDPQCDFVFKYAARRQVADDAHRAKIKK